jgi:hypothetical protein
MKIKFQHIIALAIGTMLFACKKDNYDPPGSRVSGKVVYKGEPIGLKVNDVTFELFQYGFGKVGALGQVFDQEGNFNLLLFNGSYKMVIPNGQGPWLPKATGGKPDSLDLNVTGSSQFNLEVIPYYMIRTPQLAAANGKINATFKVETVVTGADARAIENVAVYVNKTAYVGQGGDFNDGETVLAGGAIADLNNIALSVNIPTYATTQNYVYARVGLKIVGVEDRIYSPVVKINL